MNIPVTEICARNVEKLLCGIRMHLLVREDTSRRLLRILYGLTDFPTNCLSAALTYKNVKEDTQTEIISWSDEALIWLRNCRSEG